MLRGNKNNFSRQAKSVGRSLEKIQKKMHRIESSSRCMYDKIALQNQKNETFLHNLMAEIQNLKKAESQGPTP